MIHVAFDIAQTAMERAGCAWYADGLGQALARRSDVRLDAYVHFGNLINTSTAGAARIEGARLRLHDCDSNSAARIWSEASIRGLPESPPLVHANSFQAPVVAGARLIFTIHDLSFWTHPGFAAESTRLDCQTGVLDALERAAGFAFVSEASRAEFELILPGWLERTGRPIGIIPGASRFAAEPGSREMGPHAAWLCVGSIEPRKNHKTLLDAFEIYHRAVSHPRPLHLVGGRGWKSEAKHGRIASLSASGLVRHFGYVPEAQLIHHYRSAFALIQPSWHEGFGLPVVEAFGFGLPVIASSIPSLREIAANAARFFDPTSSRDLADLMIDLHNRAEVWHDMSTASANAASRYSWDDAAARAVAFYHRLLQ